MEGPDEFEKIASYFEDRSEHQCVHRWEKVLNPELVKGAWTKEVRVFSIRLLCFARFVLIQCYYSNQLHLHRIIVILLIGSF